MTPSSDRNTARYTTRKMKPHEQTNLKHKRAQASISYLVAWLTRKSMFRAEKVIPHPNTHTVMFEVEALERMVGLIMINTPVGLQIF